MEKFLKMACVVKKVFSRDGCGGLLFEVFDLILVGVRVVEVAKTVVVEKDLHVAGVTGV